MQLSQHFSHDIIFYLVFLCGQMLFILKRAGSAIRNQQTTITTRWQFVMFNWDTITIRGVIEFAMIFYPWRHFTMTQILSFFGYQRDPLPIPDSPVTSLLLGYASDSLLDWLSMSQKLPSFFRDWIHENVPKLPLLQLPVDKFLTPDPLKPKEDV